MAYALADDVKPSDVARIVEYRYDSGSKPYE